MIHADHRQAHAPAIWVENRRAETPLRVWYAFASKAEWNSPQDVKDMFGTTVDFLADNRVVFDIGGNKYRLVAHVSYRFRRVLVKFVGTHRDYDAIDAETV